MAKEISDAKIQFVSLVDKAANKKRFLIVKQKERENIMEKNINTEEQALESIVTAITSSVYKQVLKNLSDGGICSIDDETGAVIQKSDKHYLSGIIL
ncbi:MAG: hypothetical protein RR162_00010 [Oscillospiraceae bacterium]